MKSIARFGKVGMFLGVAAAVVTTLGTMQPAEAHDYRHDLRREARMEERFDRRDAFCNQNFNCAPVSYQYNNRPSLVSNVLWHLGL